MFQHIKETLRKWVDFTEEEQAAFITQLDTVSIKKKQFFLREGDICKQIAFINKGLVRLYKLKDGKEYITQFMTEGEWVSEYVSFLLKMPSLSYIEAVEDTELYLLTHDKLHKLFEQSKVFERFGRLLAEHLFLETCKRNNSLQLAAPKERYQELLQQNAAFLGKVPLKYIASYVGVEPESLSRIRKRLTYDASQHKT